MRNFLKNICFIVAVLFIGIYIVNYETAGDLGFITKSTVLYSTPDKSEASLILKPGTKIYSLAYYVDDGFDKVRYTDPRTNKKIIGFVDEDCVFHYKFPSQSVDAIGEPIILSVHKDTSFTDFLDVFSSISEDYSLIGVYIETTIDQQSDIVDFCEEQQVPYGYVSTFDDIAYEVYDSNEIYALSNYNILCQAFNITDVSYYSAEKYDLKNCILYTANSSVPDTNFNYWITVSSLSRDKNIFKNPSVKAYKYKSDSKFGYSYVSDDFEAQINRAYYD